MSFDDWAYPPDSGGKGKIIALGIILPLVIGGYAVSAWISEEAFWPGGRRVGGGMTLTGDAARGLAVCYMSMAAFCHFRWFWGLLGEERIFKVGIVLSMLTGLCAGCAALVLAL